MKKIIKFLLVSSIVAVSSDALAQEGQQLVLVTKDADGNPNARLPLTTASHLYISQEGIRVTSGDESDALLSFDTVRSLAFAFEDINGIASPEAVPSLLLSQNPVYDLLIFSEYPELPATLTIVDMKGSVRHMVDHWNGQAVDVSSLPSGLYLVTVNNITLKFVKK